MHIVTGSQISFMVYFYPLVYAHSTVLFGLLVVLAVK